MKRYFYLPRMTKEQAAKLQTGLLSHFRQHLRLAVPTVGFMPRKKTFWYTLSSGTVNIVTVREEISCYVNGFYQAIDL